MRSYRVTKSTSTATATATSVSVFGGSQPESATGRHQQGSFVGLSTTVHTPEATHIPAAEPYAGLKLLAEISASQLQIDPFEALTNYQTVSLNDDAQGQSASSLSLSDEPLLSNEPSQTADDANPIMEVAEPHETEISEDSKRQNGQSVADQNTDSTDKWIIYSGDETKPFKCGYEGCGKTYVRKHDLRRHFALHIGDSQFRCYSGDCAGAIKYCDSQALARHVHKKHTIARPFKCDICTNGFMRPSRLLNHRRNVHSIRDEQNQPRNSATDKWIIYRGDETRPFQCGYEGCGKIYFTKQTLRRHFVSHIGDSQFRCYSGDCTGAMRYCDSQALARHIHITHTTIEKPFECNICNKRFGLSYNLKRHQQNIHSTEKGRTTKKEQKPPLKRKRN